MNDWIGRTSSIYDALNRVVVQMPALGGRISYSFNAVGQRNRMTDPQGGRFSYIHDAAMQLTGLLNPQSHRTSLIYDPVGRQTGQIFGNGSRTTQVYNTASWPTVQIQADGVGTTRRTTSLYDSTGRRTATNESSGIRMTWTFDPTGQLVQEQGTSPSAFRITYVYDGAGNRTLMNELGTRTTSTYDAGNELLVAATGTARTTYSYDNNGNRTQMNAPAALTVYNWDVRNQLASAEPVSGPATYSYDGNSNRVEKQVAGTSTQYLYDFEKLLSESEGGSVTREYTSTNEQYGDLISAYSGGADSYYEFTPQFSTEALLNDSGTVTDRYDYMAFGLATHTVGTSTNPMTFVGKQGYYSDTETDQYYVRKRYYDPVTGRWLTEDRDGYRGGDANLYRYCFNDPVNHTDPSGNRMLVGSDDTFFCQQTFKRYSFATDILRDEVWWAYSSAKTWPNREDHRIYFGGGSANINDRIYAQVDPLLRNAPPDIWTKINARTGYGDIAKGLANLIISSFNTDYLLKPDWFRGNLSTGTAQERRLVSRNWFSANEYDQFRLGLHWDTKFPPAPFIIRADRFISAVEGGLGVIGELVQIALRAGLGSLLSLLGINPNDFTTFIDSLKVSISTIVTSLIDDPEKFVSTLVDGFRTGLAEFFNGFPENVLTIATEWLLGKLDIKGIKLPEKLDVPTLGFFFLDILGLNTNNLKNLLQDPGKGLDLPTSQQLGELMYQGMTINQWLGSIDNVEEILKEFDEETGTGLVAMGLEKAKDMLINFSWDAWNAAMISLVQSLFPAGGLLKMVDAFRAILANIKQFAEFLAKLGGILMETASGNWTKVKAATLTALTSGVTLGLNVLSKAFGLDKLFEKLKTKIQQWRGSIKNLFQKFLAWFKKKCAECEQAKAAAAQGQTPPPAKMPGSKPPAGPMKKNQCFELGTRYLDDLGRERFVDDPEIGGWVQSWCEGEAGWEQSQSIPALDIDANNYRVVVLGLGAARDQTEARLLRPLTWLSENAVVEGVTFFLDLPEMDAVGDALVRRVLPCPKLRPGSGRRITGSFRHRRGQIVDLYVEGEPKPIGVTPGHFIWSDDRREWVPVGLLRKGEFLAGIHGPARFLKIEETGRIAEVCNIEVEGDHCYRVGQQGLLVHNASASDPCSKKKLKPGMADWSTKTLSVKVLDRRDYKNKDSTKCVEDSTTKISTDVVTEAWGLFSPTQTTIGTGSGTDTEARRWSRCVVGMDDDDAGHVIGNALGGSGKLVDGNIFPQTLGTNRGAYRDRERLIREAISKSCRVCIHITFDYTKGGMYPGRPKQKKGITYDVYVDYKKNPSTPVDFSNPDFDN